MRTENENDGKLHSAWIKKGEYVAIDAHRLALRQYPKNDTEVFVGRVYGDKPKSHGDLRIMSQGRAKQNLNSFRGVRALAFQDLNADSHKDLILSDGWHFQYGSMAQARLTVLLGPDFSTRYHIAHFPQDYTINRIEVHHNNPSLILAQGARAAYILRKEPLGWSSTIACNYTEGDHAYFSYQSNQTYVLCSGRKASKNLIQLQ